MGKFQEHWKFCLRCNGLFYDHDNDGVCPAGEGGHDYSESGMYYLAYKNPNLSKQQDKWHYCCKCNGLFYEPKGKGVCPAGEGGHNSSRSGNYWLAISSETSWSNQQDKWHYCCRCNGLFYEPKGKGVCPAGEGGHNSSKSGNYWLKIPKGVKKRKCVWCNDTGKKNHQTCWGKGWYWNEYRGRWFKIDCRGCNKTGKVPCHCPLGN